MIVLKQGAVLTILFVFAALGAATIMFFTLLLFFGPLTSLVGAILAANLAAVAVGALIAFRRSGVAEHAEKQQGAPLADRRTATRVPAFARGRLEWNNRQSACDCVIHDLSATGARLGIPQSASPPELVELYMAEQDRTARAEVRWRMADQIGVQFLDQPDAQDLGSGDVEEQNAKLRAEIDRLRTILDDQWAPPRRIGK